MAAPLVLPDLLRPLHAHPDRAAVLCDLDGTLSPIVARPELTELPPAARAVLADLRDRFGLVGLVSGRGLTDLVRIVGLDGLAYAGNHGMELREPGAASRLAEEVAAHLPVVRAFAARWPRERLVERGLRLEDKGPSLSFHFRTAPDRSAAQAFLEAEVAPAARAVGLVPTRGRMVLEVRPPAAVDKGTAVRALLAGRGLRAACFVGDDRTDADAWWALRALRAEGALDHVAAVVVLSDELDPAVRDAANLAVEGPPGVLDLLSALGAPEAGGATP